MDGESDRDRKGRRKKQEIVKGHPELHSEKHAVGVPERKRLGEAVEAAFLAKASMLGIGVAKPWGDSRPYDFIVDCGPRRLWKVQVKCVTSHRGTRCDARAAGSGELYTEDDIDFSGGLCDPQRICGMWCRRALLFRELRFILITVRRARGCLRYFGRPGACWPVRLGRGARVIGLDYAGVRRCLCGAWCVLGGEGRVAEVCRVPCLAKEARHGAPGRGWRVSKIRVKGVGRECPNHTPNLPRASVLRIWRTFFRGRWR